MFVVALRRFGLALLAFIRASAVTPPGGGAIRMSHDRTSPSCPPAGIHNLSADSLASHACRMNELDDQSSSFSKSDTDSKSKRSSDSRSKCSSREGSSSAIARQGWAGALHSVSDSNSQRKSIASIALGAKTAAELARRAAVAESVGGHDSQSRVGSESSATL
eukprot:1249390-Prymnesium_polylepis.1